MSYTTTRRRRDRHLVNQMKDLANSKGQEQWSQFCESVNEAGFRIRLITSFRVLVGALK